MIYVSELHQHPLAYSDGIPYFSCPHCKFDVHDHDLPLLPPTVKTKWHRHPLTLTHGPIKNEDEEHNFYCDCCEEERDLKDPTYYCAKCHLISHVGCVMWEVMDYLLAKSTKVGELCNTKVIVIGEAKAIDSIYAAAGNKDRVEQGDQQDLDEDSDSILIGLRNKIDVASAEIAEYKAKLEESSLKFRVLEESFWERLSRRILRKIKFK